VFDLGSEVAKKYDQDACECDLSISLGCRPSASGFAPDGQSGSYSGPEVGFGEIAVDLPEARFSVPMLAWADWTPEKR